MFTLRGAAIRNCVANETSVFTAISPYLKNLTLYLTNKVSILLYLEFHPFELFTPWIRIRIRSSDFKVATQITCKLLAEIRNCVNASALLTEKRNL